MLRFAPLWTLVCLLGLPPALPAQLLPESATWSEADAMRHSREAIGRLLSDRVLTRTDGTPARLSEFAGKPLLISLVFTSCHHVCPVTTRRLAEAVDLAREALGQDTFNVLTIGFDTPTDTPRAMATFARQQSVHDPQWLFLSADEATIASLTTELGFVYFRSPRGFDHITQVSVVDREGRVYQQVYGAQFELPWLVEPLKELVFNRPSSAGRPIAGLLDRIRLFCTVYDPSSGRYHFDYSLFIGIGIGLAALLGAGWFLVSGLRRPGSR